MAFHNKVFFLVVIVACVVGFYLVDQKKTNQDTQIINNLIEGDTQ